MLASCMEVWLAREGHGGMVGLNLLMTIRMPTRATLHGAMLAGVWARAHVEWPRRRLHRRGADGRWPERAATR